MQRVNSTSKNLTGVNQQANPAVPSLANPGKKSNFKPIPNLNNFIKSPAIFELDSRKIGIYKLRKFRFGPYNQKQLILTYKLGRTKYKLYSYTKIEYRRLPATTCDGAIEISKGLLKQEEFKLHELPANIVTSINKNITKFNTEYAKVLLNKELKAKIKIDKKQNNFFKGLDV